MRRSMFTALLVTTTVSALSAQTLRPSRFGVIAGASLSHIHTDDDSDVGNRPGFVGGLFIEAPLSAQWTFQPELTYAMKGSRQDAGAGFTDELRLDYVEIPLLLRFDHSLSPDLTSFLLGGPSLAFKSSCKMDVSDGTNHSTLDCVTTPGSHLESADYGVAFGGGLSFLFGTRALDVGARYNLGVKNIVSDSHVKTRTFSIVGSLAWPF